MWILRVRGLLREKMLQFGELITATGVVVIVVEFVVILLTPLLKGGLSKERCGCFELISLTPLLRGVRYQFLQEETRLFG